MNQQPDSSTHIFCLANGNNGYKETKSCSNTTNPYPSPVKYNIDQTQIEKHHCHFLNYIIPSILIVGSLLES